jgi:hypothetical protein
MYWCVCFVCINIYTYIYIYIHIFKQNIAHFCIVAACQYVIKSTKITLTPVTYLAMPYLYTLSHKGTFSKKLLNIE